MFAVGQFAGEAVGRLWVGAEAEPKFRCCAGLRGRKEYQRQSVTVAVRVCGTDGIFPCVLGLVVRCLSGEFPVGKGVGWIGRIQGARRPLNGLAQDAPATGLPREEVGELASQAITSQPITSQPMTSQPMTSQPMTSQPMASEPMASCSLVEVLTFGARQAG